MLGPEENAELVALIKRYEGQIEVLKALLSRRLGLVQGPPGTGKTATATTIVAQWVRSRAFNGAVLCCSDSNIAVDNLLEGLVKKGIRAVRLGRPENTRPDLLRHSIDDQADVSGIANIAIASVMNPMPDCRSMIPIVKRGMLNSAPSPTVAMISPNNVISSAFTT